jgi:hypothetical protein
VINTKLKNLPKQMTGTVMGKNVAIYVIYSLSGMVQGVLVVVEYYEQDLEVHVIE